MRGCLVIPWLVVAVAALLCCAPTASGQNLPGEEFDERADSLPWMGLPAEQYGWSPEGLYGQPESNPLVAPDYAAALNERDAWLRQFQHSAPNDPLRNVGIGQPLVGTSWRNRPYHVGWLFGGLFGSDLVSDQLHQGKNIFGGYRAGWDFDHYWGTELRFGFAQLGLVDEQAGDLDAYARNHFWDVSLLYYPWGDACWRPFTSAGLGFGSFEFEDANGVLIDDFVLTLPLSAGVKYFYRPWLALRS